MLPKIPLVSLRTIWEKVHTSRKGLNVSQGDTTKAQGFSRDRWCCFQDWVSAPRPCASLVVGRSDAVGRELGIDIYGPEMSRDQTVEGRKVPRRSVMLPRDRGGIRGLQNSILAN